MRVVPALVVLGALTLMPTPAKATLLHEAVRSNDIVRVMDVLTSSDPMIVNEPVGPGVSPVHLACVLNNHEIADLLIRRGADVDARTEQGFTPLHWAASRDAVESARLLIEAGAIVSAEAPNGITPLHWAAYNNATNVMRLLLENDAVLDTTTTKGLTPLHWAVKNEADDAAVQLAFRIVTDNMEAEIEEHGAPLAQEPGSRSSLPTPEMDTTDVESLVPIEPLIGHPLSIPLGRGEMLEFCWINPLGLWAGKAEVSNGQFRRFRIDHDSLFRERWSLNGVDQPAVMISWFDAQAYCRWLNRYFSTRLPEGWEFRLPTVAEWETLAACGSDRVYPWGNGWPPAFGNYSDVAASRAFPSWEGIDGYDDGFIVTCPVAKSGSNAWGVFGLAGNVWEWCSDWYDPTERYKTRKGGSWDFDKEANLQITSTGFDRPAARYDTIGFRVMIAPMVSAPTPQEITRPNEPVTD